MPRQNALLDVTIAAEALHRLVEKARALLQTQYLMAVSSRI